MSICSSNDVLLERISLKHPTRRNTQTHSNKTQKVVTSSGCPSKTSSRMISPKSTSSQPPPSWRSQQTSERRLDIRERIQAADASIIMSTRDRRRLTQVMSNGMNSRSDKMRRVHENKRNETKDETSEARKRHYYSTQNYSTQNYSTQNYSTHNYSVPNRAVPNRAVPNRATPNRAVPDYIVSDHKTKNYVVKKKVELSKFDDF